MKLCVPSDQPKQRLDRYLAARLDELSRSAIQKLISTEHVRVNGQTVAGSHAVHGGDRIEIIIPARERTELQAEAIPLDISYEDDALLVINKPAGLVVHPAAGHDSGTLVHALLHHDPGIASVGGADRPGIVHRLDKGTSGVMVVAKSESSRLSLVNQFKARTVYKEYWALAHGILTPVEGRFQSELGRHPRHRQKIASVPSGRPAETEYRLLESYGGLFSGVQLVLHTGRTHQIRVHLAEAGHPIVGDKTYGGHRDTRHSLPEEVRVAIKAIHRPLLHAAVLGFQHPQSGEELRFEAPLPGDIKVLLRRLKSLS